MATLSLQALHKTYETKQSDCKYEDSSSTKAEQHEFLCCRDNVTASIGKILKHQSQSLTNLDEVLQFWISKLPISRDFEEGPGQHELLLDLIEKNQQKMYGEGFKHVPQLLKIFVTILDTNMASDDSQKKIAFLIQQLGQNAQSKAILEKFYQGLNNSVMKEKLEKCIKSGGNGVK